MYRKIFSVVAATGLVLVLGASNGMAQSVYPNPYQTPQVVPSTTLVPSTMVMPTAPSVMVNPQPAVVYRPAVGVYLNPQPLPPGIYGPSIGIYGGYGYRYPYYGRGYYRFRR